MYSQAMYYRSDKVHSNILNTEQFRSCLSVSTLTLLPIDWAKQLEKLQTKPAKVPLFT